MATNLILDCNDLLTPEELAGRLKVGVSWVYEQTRRRGCVRNSDPLPYRKMGRYLRFSWTEVIEWLNRQKGERR
jgi:predicted DNA-binding transcriptional regulator AlpA